MNGKVYKKVDIEGKYHRRWTWSYTSIVWRYTFSYDGIHSFMHIYFIVRLAKLVHPHHILFIFIDGNFFLVFIA